jgi:hypothetical protein
MVAWPVPAGSSGRLSANRNGGFMSDLVYVLLSVAVFAVLALIVRGVEWL